MANIKFSDFTGGASIVQADHFLVGFDTDATAGGSNPKNNKWTFSEVAAGLAAVAATPYSIYAANGTIGTTRKALITDTIQFRNAGDTSDIFTLNTNGTFTLGLGASTTTDSGIAIGADASSTGTSGIAIGAMTSHVTTAGQHSIAIGGSTRAAGNYSVAIGYNCGNNSSSVNSCVNIGNAAQGDGANSITLSASNAGDVGPTTSQAFGVYMSSHTTPDFQIQHDGNSYITGSGKFGIGKSNPTATLDIVHYDATRKLASFNNASATEVFSIENNGTVKIAGQAYTELHTVTSAASITPDWNNSNVQTFELTSASTTIVNPSNIKPGATYILILKQDSTGGRTVSFGTQYNFPADTAPILTTTANKADVITLVAYSSTVLMCTSVLDFTTT